MPPLTSLSGYYRLHEQYNYSVTHEIHFYADDTIFVYILYMAHLQLEPFLDYSLPLKLFNGTETEVVKSCKYLGIWLKTSFTFKTHVEQLA